MRVGLSHERRKSIDAAQYPEGKGNATNGLVELMHDLTASTEVYGSVAYKTRFPTIKDRYSARMGRALPSPDLKSENATHFELGARSEPWHGGQIEVAAFYSHVKDMIEMISFESTLCPNNSFEGFCDQAQNVGKVRRYGAELSLQQSFSPEWSAGVNYTYLHNKNLNNPELRIRDVPSTELLLT